MGILADLIQEYRPANCRFEQAALLPIRARERAAFVPEQQHHGDE